MYKWISKNVDHVIAISQQTKIDFHNYTNYDLNSISPIPIPVLLEKTSKYGLKKKYLSIMK